MRVLVVERTAADRQRTCRAGRQAAGSESHWIEAPDLTAASGMVRPSEIDFVIFDSHTVREGLEWLKAGDSTVPEPVPVVAVLSEGEEPQWIQQILDSGADCLLSRRLPASILASELRWLVTRSARRLADSRQRPMPFPKVCQS